MTLSEVKMYLGAAMAASGAVAAAAAVAAAGTAAAAGAATATAAARQRTLPGPRFERLWAATRSRWLRIEVIPR